MPRRNGPITRMELMTIEERLAEPDRCQEHWYKHLAERCKGMSILDVGAGTGYGCEILQHAGCGPVCGIDPLPLQPWILSVPLANVRPASYDVVALMDVLEHVEDDARFLKDALRVARKAVFLSTPNWHVSHAENPCHIREYTGTELAGLIGRRVKYEAWTSNGACEIAPLKSLIPIPIASAIINDEERNFGVWIPK